ncbi:MAG: hypothetical protein A2889_09505 [Nitrospinae bacterium RIFCSPLOWO2_01_FULL_39_10]|nr:MAG: hypothetical protein A2889_09505 [Nitrospinae bacterium RIFCSPLOWO2_01_FULL_39_10]
MPESKYHRAEIASKQLETAVSMFLNGRDRFSVITLAGAASNILSQLVRNQGEEPFIDYSRRVYDALIGFTPPRTKYNKYINERLGINALKHHSAGDATHIELDEEKAAEDAITKAIADYIKIKGQEEPFVKAFLSWAWKNRDGKKMMEDYKNRPTKLKGKKS